MYDLIIIGGGPAGMTAAIYAARFKLNTLLIAKSVGGYMVESPQVENFPGFKTISGIDLADKIKEQTINLGIKIVEEEVIDIEKGFTVKTDSNEYKATNIILALGTERKKLGVKGEDEFSGKGVAYCATCDAPFFRNKVVAIIGGANSAIMSALLAAKFASKVYIIYRGDKLKADPYWVKKVEETKNIEVKYKLDVKEIKGKKFVESILLNNKSELKVDGIFVSIGSAPVTELAKKLGVKLDEECYIIVDKTQKTNIDGVYAAGDISTGSNKLRQILTACAEGAIAADSVHKVLK